MARLLYNVYTVSIKNKSKRDKIKLLKSEKDSYALLKSSHISFSSTDGISYPDIVIDNLLQSSFVYVATITQDQVYCLIYIDHQIVFSGLLYEKEVTSKLKLYKSRMSIDVKYYSYKYTFAGIDSDKVEKIEYDIVASADKSKYELKPSKHAIEKLQQPLILSIISVVGVIIVIASCSVYHYCQSEKKYQQQIKVSQTTIDLWKGYRQSVQGAAIDSEVSAIFSEAMPIFTLGGTAIKQLSYSNQSLTIDLANFNHPAMRLQDFADDYHFNLQKLTANELVLEKPISNLSLLQPNTIMNADRVKAWLIDQLSDTAGSMSISFHNDSNFQNYKIIEGQLTVNALPISVLESRLRCLHNYPIRLTAMKGYVSLGSYTGEIEVNIVGGVS